MFTFQSSWRTIEEIWTNDYLQWGKIIHLGLELDLANVFSGEISRSFILCRHLSPKPRCSSFPWRQQRRLFRKRKTQILQIISWPHIFMSSPPAAQDLLPGQEWPPSPRRWLPPPFKSQESKIIFEWSPKVLNISNLLINPPVFRSIFSHLLFRELPLALQPGCLDVILDRRQTHLVVVVLVNQHMVFLLCQI